MDKIILKGISFFGHHGVSESERRKGRRFSMDIGMALDLKPAGKSDDLSRAVDYKKVYIIAKKTQASKKYHLIEALAEDVAREVLGSCKMVREITVRVRKPKPPVGGIIEYAEVEINRKQLKARSRIS